MGYLIILAILTAVLWYTRKPRVHGAVMPHTNAERAHAFSERMDIAIGLSSEAFQERIARGIRTKSRVVGRIRNIAGTTSRFRDCPFGAIDCVTTLHDGKQIFSVLQVKPLRKYAIASPAIEIVHKRPRLSLAW